MKDNGLVRTLIVAVILVAMSLIILVVVIYDKRIKRIEAQEQAK